VNDAAVAAKAVRRLLTPDIAGDTTRKQPTAWLTYWAVGTPRTSHAGEPTSTCAKQASSQQPAAGRTHQRRGALEVARRRPLAHARRRQVRLNMNSVFVEHIYVLMENYYHSLPHCFDIRKLAHGWTINEHFNF